MTRGGATVELDFLGVEKKQTNNTVGPKPRFQKFLDRRRSFREMQGAISKIDPEIIKSLLASGGGQSTEAVSGTVPMTIFYNGTVSVYQVSRNKAEEIMKVAKETTVSKKDESSTETDLSVITPTTLRPKLFGQNLEGDLPIARRKSLQRFLEKRKERVISTSPYYHPTSA
ncbi:PREDICTED: protein TIFY 9-like [Camelina sativa]|uniref:Protein TIFY n=1 Tax=Camelina sativa TaxID=90675 RepID=A0ABM0Y467_CAMSA|nr:PREDICTED: protein TIFY 9-like [Camelina sativa]